MKIVIIGGGASGFFCAISCAKHFPDHEIIIVEKTNKVLAKVKISGGGRCNVTNSTLENNKLANVYPRGAKFLTKVFAQFGSKETIKWFGENGVLLKVEPDGRMFPITDNSQTIINCLMQVAEQNRIQIRYNSAVNDIAKKGEKFELKLSENQTLEADRIMIATGGSPAIKSYDWIAKMGHQVVSPAPSLFTFNLPDCPLVDLQGLVVQNTVLKIKQTKLIEQGIVLITHWGLSGPAVLRLSAWGATLLKESNYEAAVHVNWVGGKSEEELRNLLTEYKTANPARMIFAHPLFDIPRRLWENFCTSNAIANDCKWRDLPNKSMNKLIEKLNHDVYDMKGKTTFKEEFVTAGGIDLAEVDANTMESKKLKGIFFGGEVLDIDGITGGYNFQAAWSTGWVAGKNIGL